MFRTFHTNKLWKLIPGITKNVSFMRTVKQTNAVHIGFLNRNLSIFNFSNDKNSPENPKGNEQNKEPSSPFVSRQQMFKKQQQQAMKADPTEDQSTYEKPSSSAGTYFMLISTGLLFLAYAMMQMQTIRAEKKNKTSVSGLTKLTSTGKAAIGGQWTLIDTNGRQFSSKDLQGSYYLIYFGFTNCPDICPNSLMKLAKAVEKIKKMPEGQYFKLKTVFVSVDPDRDDASKIRKFVDYFDTQIIGVTGKQNNDPDLKECMKKFKIYSSKIEFNDPQKVQKGRKAYTIDHTILTYLMDDNNEYLTHLGANLGEHDLAKTIVNAVLKNEQQRMKKLKV